MTWLFLQTWFWHLVAFLLGALVTWLLFAKPWSRQRADSAAGDASRDLAAARARVTSLEADLAACKKGRAEDNEASQREIGGLRVKLDRANAPAGAGILGAERANEDITMTSDLTAVAAGVRAGTDQPAAEADTSGAAGAEADTSGAADTQADTSRAADSEADTSRAADTEADTSGAADTEADTSRAADTEADTSGAGAGAAEPGPYGAGSAKSLPDGSAPEGFTIKGNADSGLFHTVDSPWYGRTKAEAWFDTEESAKAAGFTHWKDRNNRKK